MTENESGSQSENGDPDNGNDEAHLDIVVAQSPATRHDRSQTLNWIGLWQKVAHNANPVAHALQRPYGSAEQQVGIEDAQREHGGKGNVRWDGRHEQSKGHSTQTLENGRKEHEQEASVVGDGEQAENGEEDKTNLEDDEHAIGEDEGRQVLEGCHAGHYGSLDETLFTFVDNAHDGQWDGSEEEDTQHDTGRHELGEGNLRVTIDSLGHVDGKAEHVGRFVLGDQKLSAGTDERVHGFAKNTESHDLVWKVLKKWDLKLKTKQRTYWYNRRKLESKISWQKLRLSKWDPEDDHWGREKSWQVSPLPHAASPL